MQEAFLDQQHLHYRFDFSAGLIFLAVHSTQVHAGHQLRNSNSFFGYGEKFTKQAA